MNVCIGHIKDNQRNGGMRQHRKAINDMFHQKSVGFDFSKSERMIKLYIQKKHWDFWW